MSKDISVALDSHLSGETTTIATCVKATLTNGTIFGFSNHDADLIIDGLTYLAGAYTATDVETSAALNVDNLEFHGALGTLTSDLITEDDLHAGLWDKAAVRIFQVNWADLTQGILRQRVGTLGEVSIGRGAFQAEHRGRMQAYSEVIGELTSPGCRATFGDERCKFPIETVTFPGTVLSVVDNMVITFDDSSGSPPESHPAGYYDYGLIRFLTGENAGLEMEIKSHVLVDSPAVAQITLQLPMPYEILADSPADTFEVVKGCGRTFAHCKAHDNVLNFRGEPSLPGQDRIIQVAGR